jgi:stage V sporulation protein B
VAEIQAENKLLRLKRLIQKVFFFGFGLGSICGIGFLIFGSFIGRQLFDNTRAGDFIQTLAFICPFLYMNTTLMSILNGLGKATQSFLINICGLAIRIVSVWFMIPLFSIRGYLWGLLASQLLVSILCIWQLKLYIEKRELF